MKVLSTFEITKGFDRWLHLVDVELKPLLKNIKLKFILHVPTKMKLECMTWANLKILAY